MTFYITVINKGTHSGYVAGPFLRAQMWSNQNPHGLTYQDICGPHGQVLVEGHISECEQALKKWLDCPRARAGQYCYTHNRDGAR